MLRPNHARILYELKLPSRSCSAKRHNKMLFIAVLPYTHKKFCLNFFSQSSFCLIVLKKKLISMSGGNLYFDNKGLFHS